jgi:hypothetical protein
MTATAGAKGLRGYMDLALQLPFEEVAIRLETYDRMVQALRDIRAFGSEKDQQRAAVGLGDDE